MRRYDINFSCLVFLLVMCSPLQVTALGSKPIDKAQGEVKPLVEQKSLDEFNTLSKEEQKIVWLAFIQDKKSLKLAYPLSLIGFHPMHIECCYIGGAITLLCVIVFAISCWFLRDLQRQATDDIKSVSWSICLACVIVSGILMGISWVVQWVILPDRVRRANENILKDKLATRKLAQKGMVDMGGVPKSLKPRLDKVPIVEQGLIVARFRREQKKLSIAYLPFVFGLHPLYLGCSYLGLGITLFEMCLLCFALTYFGIVQLQGVDSDESNIGPVICCVIFLAILFVIEWKALPNSVDKANEKKLDKHLTSLGY